MIKTILVPATGNETDAARWLRRAAHINPKNSEVASELHLLDLRRRQK